MTCIIGWIKDKKIYMGSDSAGSNSFIIMTRNDEKVFIRDEMIFGYTSSFRMGQLLRFSLKIPLRDPKLNAYEYMCTKFIDAVRDCFKDGGFLEKKDSVEEGGTFLVGYKGKLYKIEDDLQVGIPAETYSSVGGGMYFALGAMKVLQGSEERPEDIINKSLEAAESFCVSVRRPFKIMSIPVKEGE